MPSRPRRPRSPRRRSGRGPHVREPGDHPNVAGRSWGKAGSDHAAARLGRFVHRPIGYGSVQGRGWPHDFSSLSGGTAASRSGTLGSQAALARPLRVTETLPRAGHCQTYDRRGAEPVSGGLSMRILYVSPYAPERCGIGDYTAAFARTVRERGVEVGVVTASELEGAPSEVVLALPHTRRGVRELVREIEAWNADVVHVEFAVASYALRLPVLFALLRALRPLEVRVVMTLHEATRDT